MKRLNVILALLLLVCLTGCMTQTARDKRDHLCANLESLHRAIAALNQLTDSSNVSALKQLEEQVTLAFREVKASAREISGTPMDDLEQAYTDLDNAVEDIPDQSTLPQAMAAIADQLTTLESALTRMQSGVRCPSLEAGDP